MKPKDSETLNLTDVTFNIPIRFDSRERKENVELVVEYLLRHLNAHIIICEESRGKMFSHLQEYGCKYIYIYSEKPHLHRTRCLNLMAKKSKTPIICNYDSDVLLHPGQYLEAAAAIRRNEYDACFPYDGRFYNLARHYYKTIKETLSLSRLNEKKCPLLNRRSIGGALFWNKEAFFAGGMENENFIGWGYEDNELVERFTGLGFTFGRAAGGLFHLDHPREPVGSFNSLKKIAGYIRSPILKNNKREYNKVKAMSKEELSAYIKTWNKS
ncbi:MAG: glycosyltransferase family 2 protein [Candidatus Aminicenantes bacterium]|jgi:hypothetical protein|nr:glycosyltransferase family 2 protein [Candidatus Aminicenantes bacterium]